VSPKQPAAHAWVVVAGHVPPLHVEGSVAAFAAHDAAPQGASGYVHAAVLVPSQLPAQTPVASPSHLPWCGAPETGAQWPSCPGRLHASQSPVQGASQQKPSTHVPAAHAPPGVQATAFVPEPTPPSFAGADAGTGSLPVHATREHVTRTKARERVRSVRSGIEHTLPSPGDDASPSRRDHRAKAVIPPSTTTVLPVTYEAASDRSHAHAFTRFISGS
jgi:hypothetical protein